MSQAQIFEEVKKLIEGVREFPGDITVTSRLKENLGMEDAQVSKVIGLAGKIYFFVAENEEICAIKTVQDIINLIEERLPKEDPSDQIPNIPVPDSQIA